MGKWANGEGVMSYVLQISNANSRAVSFFIEKSESLIFSFQFRLVVGVESPHPDNIVGKLNYLCKIKQPYVLQISNANSRAVSFFIEKSESLIFSFQFRLVVGVESPHPDNIVGKLNYLCKIKQPYVLQISNANSRAVSFFIEKSESLIFSFQFGLVVGVSPS
ncbi:hypothetical protein CK510_00455 [Brunnivagina elsteri CCALA 953]|uniref:Uncharacterized protein n=1 Tax=Brunnivagina elsteri CCALA 953 TaxID=987040 RepID=A0A2A2TQM0_9CYAN|nr:hypothetical protein CK510_00455 [Calothrix elsteri CCALA 953]